MKKIILSLATVGLMAVSCKEQPSGAKSADGSGYTLTGKIKNKQEGKVYLSELNQQQFVAKDTATIDKEGNFTFTGSVPEPGIYSMKFEDEKMIIFVLDNKKIEVEADASDIPNTYTIKGSKDSELVKELNRIMVDAQQKVAPMSQRFMQAQAMGQQDSLAKIEAEVKEVQNENIRAVKQFIRQNPNSVVAAYSALHLINPDTDYEFADSVAGVFSKTMPESKYSKALSEKLNSNRSAAIGQVAPDIKLPSPDGKEIALSSLRGKYVLIDFWASWCGPCRRENPNVVRMYNKYKDKGFEIFGVSLDQSKEKWVKAIADDKLTWPHVSDLKGWNSSAAQLYNVSAIPQTILLDKEGKIIAKNLRGEELEAKVASLVQ